VAGANYEVNIQLKADPALKSLERIEQKINKLTKTSVDLQDARGAAMVKNRNLADRINKLEEKGVKVTKMRERLAKAIAKVDKGSLQTAAAHEKILNREVKKEERLLQVKKDQLKVDNQQQRRRGGFGGGGGRLGQAILGGGFPLLFGGSPFQALGGAVGGAFGGFAGGIGLQVAVGQIENLFSKASELGQGLSELNFDLAKVTESAGFAGTETAQLLERIEQYGDAAKAAELATKLLEARVGKDGVKALKDFGEKAGELGRALSTIFSQVLAGIAKVAGPLLNSLAKFAGEQAALGAFKARTDLVAGSKEAFAQQILTGQGLPQGPGARKARLASEAKRLGLDLRSSTQFTDFARQTAVESQKAFELPTIQEIEFQASQVEDPTQRRARTKEERESVREFLREQKQQEKDRLALIEAENKITLDNLRKTDQIVESQDKRAGLLEARLSGTQEEYELNQRIEKIKTLGLKPAEEAALINAERNIASMEDQVKLLERQERLYAQIGQTIKEGIVDGIMRAIDGTRSLTESLSGILRQIGGQFLSAGIGSFGKDGKKGTGLLGLLGFADGGRPPVGRPSIVGERGPELFVPDRAGTIVPNHAMGGANVVVNVDASGSSVEGDADQAQQLGKAIGIAVQQELVKQKRPGGLLAR
jgi:hypothetical protein